VDDIHVDVLALCAIICNDVVRYSARGSSPLIILIDMNDQTMAFSESCVSYLSPGDIAAYCLGFPDLGKLRGRYENAGF